jgi:hypothetical protein
MNKQIIARDPLELDQLDQMRRDMQQDVRRHYQSRTVAVTIPFYQSVISGLLAGILVAILLYALGVKAKWILIGFAMTWISVTAIVWWVRLRDWQALIWNMEQQLGIDLTGDQVIGQPVIIRAEVSRNGGANKTYANLEGRQLHEFLNAILTGETISEARWTPAKNGFSKSEYWRVVSELIRAGVLRWKNDQAHDQGVILTGDGREILAQWIKELEPA